MTLLAHSARGNHPEQTYRDHICGVTDGAERNLASITPYLDDEKAKYYLSVLKRAAEFHDLGKLSKKNQAVLHQNSNLQHLPIEHRDAGVKYLLGNQRECPEATLVYSHHRPGLPNLTEEADLNAPFRLGRNSGETMADTDAHLSDYIEAHNRELGKSDENMNISSEESKLSSMEYRILLSCLVDADYSDTSGEKLTSVNPRWEERLAQLDRYVARLSENCRDKNSERNKLRTDLYQSCRDASTDFPLEYCDSPVGTGKTTAVMAHMLKAAQEHNLRHIFVVLPYTNIITQTVEVLRNALVLDDEDDASKIVAEHHHQADFDSTELRHLASTWNAPIIVTTAVQFFETIASNLPSKLRKLHQLPASGIIIDESHAALPNKLIPPAWMWMTDLIENWGCRICLCSGTSVKFWESIKLEHIPVMKAKSLLNEDISKKLEIFENNRITFDFGEDHKVPNFRQVDDLIGFLEAYHGSKIVVLNTVKSAAYLAKTMRARGLDVLHLSTALMPKDRNTVIDEIKYRLNSESRHSQSWTLVATSCVECGMDFSFNYGFCELRSLQSYFQLGGRVSRNGEFDDGTLFVFTVNADNFSPNPAFNDSISIFKRMINKDEFYHYTMTEAITQAFDIECKRGNKTYQDICKYERHCDFAAVAENFKVINDETVTVVADRSLAENIRKGKFVTQREFQMGSVNMRQAVLNQLGIKNDTLPILSENQYDNFLGYMKSLV